MGLWREEAREAISQSLATRTHWLTSVALSPNERSNDCRKLEQCHTRLYHWRPSQSPCLIIVRKLQDDKVTVSQARASRRSRAARSVWRTGRHAPRTLVQNAPCTLRHRSIERTTDPSHSLLTFVPPLSPSSDLLCPARVADQPHSHPKLCDYLPGDTPTSSVRFEYGAFTSLHLCLPHKEYLLPISLLGAFVVSTARNTATTTSCRLSVHLDVLDDGAATSLSLGIQTANCDPSDPAFI
ncbi:hypothetical protein BDW22DRAFT_1361579, partial [Trametopsis cervina]